MAGETSSGITNARLTAMTHRKAHQRCWQRRARGGMLVKRLLALGFCLCIACEADEQGAVRSLLGFSRQSELATTGAGMLNYQPLGFHIDGADFTQFVLEAHANAAVEGIRVQPGTYHVSAKVEDAVHLHVQCSRGRTTPFEIDLSGVFFYFTDVNFGGVWIEQCSNLNFHGPYEQTWTNEELPFTQGKILTMDDTKEPYMATVQVDDGYPSDRVMLTSTIKIITYLSDTLMVKNQPCPDLQTPPGVVNRRKLDDKTYQFQYLKGCAGAAGDLFVARGDYSSMGIRVDHCNSTLLQDITIYSAGVFGIFQDVGMNNTFASIQVRPFPRPLGKDGRAPLLSSCADAFHAANAHRGTTVRDCLFMNSGDDAISMHGGYYAVAATDAGKRSVTIASNSGFPFVKEDTLVFYGGNTALKGSAVIAGLHSVNQPDSTSGKIGKNLLYNDAFTYDDCDFLEVRLKTWPKGLDRVLFDDVVACPSANGNGFAIINNVVGNLRGRGTIVKSSNGVIANNIYFNLMHWAIELAPEWGWKEADFVHNILVANNSINSNGSGIWLGVDPWTWDVPPTFINNYAVDFVGNTIANVQSSPFIITSSAQVRVQNNSFVNVLCGDALVPAFDWATPDSLVYLANVGDIAFLNNSIVNNAGCLHPQGNYAHPVSMVNTTNIAGVQR